MLIQTKPIQTADRIISVEGKVFYNERRRRIDIKRPIRDLFGGNDSLILYRMELCLSEAKALSRVKELTSRNVYPVLLYFMKGEEKDGI